MRPVDVPTESRSELQASRRVRRRLMVACALVVAVCVILTILIVGLARDRPPGSSARAGSLVPPPTLAVGSPAHPLATTHPPNRGAPAS